MLMSVLVTIIVPVYNNEQYISRCLKSIMNQTYENFEVLIVNDGSSDMTEKICCLFANTDSRFHLVSQINGGVSRARNRGLIEAKGKYICFVDSDDILSSLYIETLVNNMTDGGLSVCKWTNKENSYKNEQTVITLSKIEAEISALVSSGMEGYPFCKLFDRNVIISNNIVFDIDITLCEDLLFLIKYLKYMDGTIKVSDSVLYFYYSNQYGALQKRFSETSPLKKTDLSEYEALIRCKQYLESSEPLDEYYALRRTKAAEVTLRTLVAKKTYNHNCWKTLLDIVRMNCIKYTFNRLTIKSSKISIILCSISPKLDYLVWKWSNRL